MRRHPAAVLSAVVVLLAGGVRVDRPVRAAESDTFYAYRAARIITGDGKTLSPGTIVVRGDSIEAVLDGDGKVPADATIVDLGDVVVVPGFVNPLSSISSTAPRSGVAQQSGGQPSDGRRNEAAGAVKLDAPVHRRLGRSPYLAYGWLPSPQGLFAGQAAVLRPARGKETDAKELILRENSFLLMNFELGSRWRDSARNLLSKAAEAVVKEREAASKAVEKKPDSGDKKNDEGEGAEKKPAPAANTSTPSQRGASSRSSGTEKPPPPDPLIDVMKGELRLIVRLRSPAILDHFFALYDELAIKPRLTLILPPLPPELITRLAERKGSIDAVVVGPRISSLWETSIALNSVRHFLESGFEVALVPERDDLEGLRRMPFHLAQLLKGGVGEDQALAAVTRVPARLLGVEGKVGVVAPGALASFVVFGGDPMAGTAPLLRVFVAGTEVFYEHAATGELCGEAVR